MDDILVFTKTLEEHDQIIKEVLQILKDNDLFLKESKCLWKQECIEFLGMDISAQGIHMSKEKVKAIIDWPVPKMVKNVRQFLGLANYYRCFIKSFSQIAHPIQELT